MKTEILKINPINPEKSKIKIAARIIQRGGIVAFPTETVYGLGANALNQKAIKKIFKAKGRPIDNPLIVHIADKKEVYTLAKKVPKEAERLIEKFWPGPLTIILIKSKIVPKTTTAGLETVAIRMPANRIALSLIKETKMPIAAPSANLSGKPSPTRAEHVILDLYGKIDAIIDGSIAKIGVESTVLDLTTNPPTLLRPGGINLQELKEVLGMIEIHPLLKERKINKIVVKSPGMKYKHYAPKARIIVIEGEYEKVEKKIQQLIGKYKKEGKVVGVMTTNKNNNYKANIIKFMGIESNTIAKNLFKDFREFDKEKVDLIIAEGVSDEGLGFAIMNRLKRASSKIIKV